MKTRKQSVLVYLMWTIGLIACVSSCGGNSTPTETRPYINATLVSLPSASAPANYKNAMVYVQRGDSGINVTDATVTLNGVALAYNPSPNHEQYEETIIIAPGDTVTLSVTVDGKIYTASGTQSNTYPTISSPVSGVTWQTINDNTIAWSGGAPTTNALYVFGVLNAADPNGHLIWPVGTDDTLMQAPISRTSYTIPANSLSAGDHLITVCLARIASIPNTAAHSTLGIGGCNYVPIPVN